jgi:hypothetical protein
LILTGDVSGASSITDAMYHLVVEGFSYACSTAGPLR